jgi:hypothetical protein
MAATHTVRIPQATRPTAAVSDGTTSAAESSSGVATADRWLWLQVGIAAALGASAAMLGTWAIVATQTLQMHF